MEGAIVVDDRISKILIGTIGPANDFIGDTIIVDDCVLMTLGKLRWSLPLE